MAITNYLKAVTAATKTPQDLLQEQVIYVDENLSKLGEARNKVYLSSKLPDSSLILGTDGYLYEIITQTLDEDLNKYEVTITASAEIKLVYNSALSENTLDKCDKYLAFSKELDSYFTLFLKGVYGTKEKLNTFFLAIIDEILNNVPVIQLADTTYKLNSTYALDMFAIKYYDPTKTDYSA